MSRHINTLNSTYCVLALSTLTLPRNFGKMGKRPLMIPDPFLHISSIRLGQFIRYPGRSGDHILNPTGDFPPD